jgi:hypothetical protein
MPNMQHVQTRGAECHTEAYVIRPDSTFLLLFPVDVNFYKGFSSIRVSTTTGSAKVDVSPNSSSCPPAIFRKMRRIILPLRVLGRPGAQ